MFKQNKFHPSFNLYLLNLLNEHAQLPFLEIIKVRIWRLSVNNVGPVQAGLALYCWQRLQEDKD